eukprot:CAMPEP_0203861300 /NCGR_PEP_ID=MMETSP0359-20131031/12928_1 /ASSEMBLY_ACC=CAM_ASM_000338 /TAXON_ID=268821 /ORGANISM="Scrippsiella Hangoei, Strain SHTV-5" /LENGTH=51 /DNA_ID=CAMNT_0050778505 /DNA_START=145 /DNA_END=297 /DNA_ORIENTATION=+
MVQAWEGHESFSQAADDVARKLLEDVHFQAARDTTEHLFGRLVAFYLGEVA